MPVPPRRRKDLIEGTADHHASLTHPDLQEVTIRWRGSFGYLIASACSGHTARGRLARLDAVTVKILDERWQDHAATR
jgi:hypothetical protein